MRQAILIAATLCGLALAGCSGNEAVAPASTSDGGPSVVGASGIAHPGNASAPRNVTPATQQLHLLAPPGLGRLAANHTLATPKVVTYEWQGFAWNTTIRHKANVTAADFDVYLRVTASQSQAGLQDPGCTLTATLTFTINKTARQVNGGCGSAGLGVIAPGDHEVRFGATPDQFAVPVLLGPGDDVRIDLVVWTQSAGLGPSCYILGGPGTDSALRLAGLNETADWSL